MLTITEGKQKGHNVVKIKSHWNTYTSHECQACNKDFSGENAALVELDNGQDAIICSECVNKIEQTELELKAMLGERADYISYLEWQISEKKMGETLSTPPYKPKPLSYYIKRQQALEAIENKLKG